MVLENERGKLVWDFGFHLRKTTTVRRPDRIKQRKKYGFAKWHALNNGTLRLKG